MKPPSGGSAKAQSSEDEAIMKSMDEEPCVSRISDAADPRSRQPFVMGRRPCVNFGADWSVIQSDALVAGGKVIVRYERARLAGDEQLVQGGEHVWVLSGFVSLNGSSPQTFQLGGRSSDAIAEQVLELTEAGTVELWFERSDLYGAHHYDSNYGQNFRFTVLPEGGEANVARQVPLQVPVPGGAR